MFSIPVQYFPFEYASRIPVNTETPYNTRERVQEKPEEYQPRREAPNGEEIMRAFLNSFAGPFRGSFGEGRYADNEETQSRNGTQGGHESQVKKLERELQDHFIESKRQLQKDLERYSSTLKSKLDAELRKHAFEAEQKLEQQLHEYAQEALKSLEKSKLEALEYLRGFENRERKEVEERRKRQQEEEITRKTAEEKKKAEEERKRQESLKRKAEEQRKVQEEKHQEALRRQAEAARRKEQEDECRKQEEAAHKSHKEAANEGSTKTTSEADPTSVADNVVRRLLSGQFDDKTEAENFLSQLLFLASQFSNRPVDNESNEICQKNNCRECGRSAGSCASCKSSASEQCACDNDKAFGLYEESSERKPYETIKKSGDGDDEEFVVLSTRI